MSLMLCLLSIRTIRISHTHSQLMIRSCPHLSKYMSTPEDSRRFISANPLQDLEMGAIASPIPGGAGVGATAAASATSQLAALQSADSALHHLHRPPLSSHPALLSHLLAAGSSVADPLLQSLSLGNLHAGLLGRVAPPSLPAQPTSPEPAQGRSAIASFLANSQSSGGATRNRQGGAKK